MRYIGPLQSTGHTFWHPSSISAGTLLYRDVELRRERHRDAAISKAMTSSEMHVRGALTVDYSSGEY